MATSDEKIIIEIELDDGSLAKGFVKSKKVAQTEGQKAGKSYSKAVESNADFSKLQSKLVSVGAGLLASLGIRETIRASIEQDKAVKKVESSLRSLGRYTPQLSKELQDFASQLQRQSRFGDEATLSQIAFAQAMGANVEQSKQIVAAAQDMAVALDIDFNSAVRNITKTLGGFAGELGEVIPELKNLSAEQLQSGAGIDLLSKKYQGFALRDLATFDAKLEQSKNTLGDFAEAIGDLITKSDTATGFLSDMEFAISGLTVGLKQLSSKDITDAQKEYTEEIKKQTLEIERLEGVLKNIDDYNNDGSILTAIFGGPDPESINVQITNAKNRIKALKYELDTLTSSNKEDGSKGKPNLAVTSTELESIRSAQFEYQELSNKLVNLGYDLETVQSNISNPQFVTDVEINNQRISTSFGELSNSLRATAAKIKVTNEQVANAMINGIGNGTAQAFRAFGEALVEGENALEAMLNSFLASMGNMAVQLGSLYILQGTAMLFSPIPTENAKGPPLIKAGAALAAFGGILGALGGKQAKESNTSSSISQTQTVASPTVSEQTTLEQEEIERQAPQQFHFHGEILGDERSAERIVEYIKIAQNNGAIA